MSRRLAVSSDLVSGQDLASAKRVFGVVVKTALLAAMEVTPEPVAAMARRCVGRQDTAWRPELRLQLEEEHGCELDFLTSVRVKHLNGRLLVNVRAHCKDGRAFDAKRDGVLMPFEIRRFLTFAETLATRPPHLDATLGVIAVPAGLDMTAAGATSNREACPCMGFFVTDTWPGLRLLRATVVLPPHAA